MEEVKRWHVVADDWEIVECNDRLKKHQYVLASDYDALFAKYQEIEASIPIRQRAAFSAGWRGGNTEYGELWNKSGDAEAYIRYPNKESK